MAIFVTSDTHFGHSTILRPDFCGEVRRFASAREMDDEIVRRWNARIGDEDEVYHLGDAFWWRMKPHNRARTFARLKGVKHLIVGNHDDAATLDLPWASKSLVKYVTKNDIKFRLSHHPPEERTLRREQGSRLVWLHGHIHSMTEPGFPAFDAGVDANNLKPWKFNDIAKRAKDWFEQRERGMAFLASGGQQPCQP